MNGKWDGGKGGKRGYLLVEMLIYMGLFIVVVSLSITTFLSCLKNYQSLQNASGDIVQALRVGERWRAEVRGGSTQTQWTDSGNGPVFQIETGSGTVRYRFADGALWRSEKDGRWASVLPRVKFSEIAVEKRGDLAVWKWELELEARAKGARLRPRFTFLSLPSLASKP